MGIYLYTVCLFVQLEENFDIFDCLKFSRKSLWVEIMINTRAFLFGTFYSAKPQDQLFFDAFDRNIEKAMELSQAGGWQQDLGGAFKRVTYRTGWQHALAW